MTFVIATHYIFCSWSCKSQVCVSAEKWSQVYGYLELASRFWKLNFLSLDFDEVKCYWNPTLSTSRESERYEDKNWLEVRNVLQHDYSNPIKCISDLVSSMGQRDDTCRLNTFLVLRHVAVFLTSDSFAKVRWRRKWQFNLPLSFLLNFKQLTWNYLFSSIWSAPFKPGMIYEGKERRTRGDDKSYWDTSRVDLLLFV